MDPADLWARAGHWLDARAISKSQVVTWVLGGLVVLAVGLWLTRPASLPVEESLPIAEENSKSSTDAVTPSSDPLATTTTLTDKLIVYAAGAVKAPGVYELPAHARVNDLIEAAGGLIEAADVSRLNLAAHLLDGDRVYAPHVGEEIPAVDMGPRSSVSPSSGPSSGPPGRGDSGLESGPINLNMANADELDSLPGVGPATATAIVSYRDTNGPFSSVEDLIDVRGIGDAKLEQLRPLVTV